MLGCSGNVAGWDGGRSSAIPGSGKPGCISSRADLEEWDGLSGLACVWRSVGSDRKGGQMPLILCLFLPALPVGDRGLGHHLCRSHPRL